MWTANAPALLLLLPCSCIAPDLPLACSQPTPGLLIVCSPQFGSLHRHQDFTTFFGTAIAAFYGIVCVQIAELLKKHLFFCSVMSYELFGYEAFMV